MTHLFRLQRYYNIQCWVYGQNPKQNADLVGDDALPQERADLCPDEWSRLETAWGILLAPFVKD